MLRVFGRWRCAGFAAVLGLAAVLPAKHAAAFLQGPGYSGVLPQCEAGLSIVAHRFAVKESRFWNSALQIVGFEGLRETAYRPWAPNTIPRRFCSAVALVSDGRKRPVYYWIGEVTGMFGTSWGVEWCVVGLDRNLAYNPGCKMAKP